MGIGESTRDVVLIGYGEVGRAFGARVEQSGVAPVYVDPAAEGVHGARTVLGSLPAGIPSGALVLGAFPSAAALAVADDVASRDGAFLYVDLSSSPQGLMRDCAAAFDATRAAFVDGAIMGSVALAGAGAPIVLSGPEAGRAARALGALGFDAEALPDSRAGDAGGLKLLRTLLTKGIEALAVECFAAARRMGLEEEIRASLSDIGARPFPELLEAMVRTHVVHAPRRRHEVEAALGQARSLGLKAPVTEAVLGAYRETARRIEAERPGVPADLDQAVSWLSKGLE